jgi:hypothetical protein
LTGELDSQRKRLSEEETKCQADFECGINELPDIIVGFKDESEGALVRAEITLGLREGEMPAEAPVEEVVEEEAPAPVVKKQPQPTPNPVRKVRMPVKTADEDGLL